MPIAESDIAAVAVAIFVCETSAAKTLAYIGVLDDGSAIALPAKHTESRQRNVVGSRKMIYAANTRKEAMLIAIRQLLRLEVAYHRIACQRASVDDVSRIPDAPAISDRGE